MSPVRTRSQRRSRHQSLKTSNPVQHHSAHLGELPEPAPPLLDEELDQDNCYVSHKNLHHSRKTNVLPDFQRNKQERINFPLCSDPVWRDLDKELSTALPNIFNRRTLQKLSSQELIQKFDVWVHAFFLERCGPVEEKIRREIPRKARPNKAMTRFVRIRNG